MIIRGKRYSLGWGIYMLIGLLLVDLGHLHWPAFGKVTHWWDWVMDPILAAFFARLMTYKPDDPQPSAPQVTREQRS